MTYTYDEDCPHIRVTYTYHEDCPNIRPGWLYLKCRVPSPRLPEIEVAKVRVLMPLAEALTESNQAILVSDFEITCPIPWFVTLGIILTRIDAGEPTEIAADWMRIELKFEFGKLTSIGPVTARRGYWMPSEVPFVGLLDQRRLHLADGLNRELRLAAQAESEKEGSAPTPERAEDPETETNNEELEGDLLSALKALGYTKSEARVRARQAFSRAPTNPTLQDLITLSLKKETKS